MSTSPISPKKIMTLRIFKTSGGVIFLVFVCLAFVIVANALWNGTTGRQSPFLLALLLAFAVGFLTVANTIEKLAVRWNVAQGKWILAIVFGVIVYVERAKAMGDINAVFPVDPSALPMTLIAVTATRTAIFFEWPFFLAFAICIPIIWRLLADARNYEKNDQIIGRFTSSLNIVSGRAPPASLAEFYEVLFPRIAQLFTVTILCAIAWILVLWRLSSPEKIHSVVYQVAIQSDFVDHFDCKGFKVGQYRALLIGPEQRDALFLPIEVNKDTNTETNLADKVLTEETVPIGIRAKCDPLNGA